MMLSQEIKRRIFRQNKNSLGAFLGETGSGKSWSTLRLCEKVDKNFTIDNVVFSPLECLERITELKKTILMFDEAGVGIGSRDWNKEENKAFNKVMQTFRHRNIALVFTTPNLSFLDIQCRQLMQYSCESKYVDLRNERVLFDVIYFQSNRIQGKQYYKKPRVVIGRKVKRMDRMWVRKPNEELIKHYEKKKDEFTTKLNREVIIQMKIKKIQEAGMDKITEKQWEVFDRAFKGEPAKQTMRELGITSNAYYDRLKKAKKHGWNPLYSNILFTTNSNNP